MANYRLGPVIGKIGGGAEVQKIPVEALADGGTGSEVIVHTVHVPEGEKWLVFLAAYLSPRFTNTAGPVISFGEESIGPSLPEGRTWIVAEVTGTAEITLKRNTNTSSDTLSGHVYAVPLP